MKPQRQFNLEKMNTEQLENKVKDIVRCIKGAKSMESREAFLYQLDVANKILETKKQLVLNFDNHVLQQDQRKG